jgi:hypothetical protein
VHDNSCEIQEQRFVAQCVLHPQQMSNIRASDVGCWFMKYEYKRKLLKVRFMVVVLHFLLPY